MNADRTSGVLASETAPTNGANEVQTVTVTGTPTGGTFRLKFKSQITGTLNHNANAATVQAALEALSRIGSGNVVCSGSLSSGMTVTFQGTLERLAVPLIVLAANALTGGTSPTVTIVRTTTGITATKRGALPGEILKSEEDGKSYVNQGTQTAPEWVAVGTEAEGDISADGAVTIPDSGEITYYITKGSAAALTLAAPSAAQEGVEITFVSRTAFAHTITATTVGFNDTGTSGDVATFGGAKGDGLTVKADAGDWMITSRTNITLS